MAANGPGAARVRAPLPGCQAGARLRLRARNRAAYSDRGAARERENRAAAKDESLAPDELFQRTAEGTEGRCQLNLLKPQERDNIADLRKQLYRTRQLLSAVRSGRGYFHLLQRESQDLQEAQLQECKRTTEVHHAGCRSPSSGLDREGDETQGSQQARKWTCWTHVGSKERPAVRPFTPVHHSLTSPQQSSGALEPLFRQLCCLNWLLEVLISDPVGPVGPISSCWDPRDPGRSRTTMKTLKKEKEIEAKWCRFVSQLKSKKTPHRIPQTLLRHSENSAPSSSFSVVSSCTATPTVGSLSSLIPGPEASQPAGSSTTGGKNALLNSENTEDEQPVSNYLQKLLDEVYRTVTKQMKESDQGGELPSESSLIPTPIQGKKENPADRETACLKPKNCSVMQPSAACLFIERKASMLKEMRAAFQQRSQEQALNLRSTLESRARQRWECSVKKFQALYEGRCCRDFHHISARCSRTQEAMEQLCHSSWLQVLLNSLPEAALRDPRLNRVLYKLSRFTDGRRLRARPQVFLRVLSALPPWELCCPDLCAAVEIVREYVVQMTKEDYDTWLQSRVVLPYRAQSAPHIR